ncbi:MAG: InlB B-repeat-containing protein [Thermoplasmata archaeon]
MGYSPPGAADSWVYDEIGAQAYTYEIYTGEYEEDFAEGFYPPKEDIMTINEDLDDSLIYQTRVADADLGDGEDLEHPPVPYLVYGTLENEGGDHLSDIEIEVENQETGENLSVETNSKGYYELNLANLIDHGYEIGDTLCIQIDPGTTMMNFDVDGNWGKRIDLEYTEGPQVTTESVSALTNESAEFEGRVELGNMSSVEGYFQYRMEGEESWQESEIEVIEENRTYDMVIDGMESDESYEVRASIKCNEEEQDFGRILSFITTIHTLNLDSSIGGEVIKPGESEFEYTYGSEVTIEASAEENYDFIEWIGDVDTVEDTESSETTVGITDDIEITALFQTGEGSEGDPYLIENSHHLQKMEDNLEAHYELATDIDASETEDWNDGRGFDPVGDQYNPFEGTFDGGRYKIDDLHINQENMEYTGLFGVIGEGSEVTNLALVNINVTGSHTRSHWVGGLAGGNLGLINNTSVSGDVNSGDVAGGLIGQGPGTVKNSYSTGDVTGARFVGGLQGTSSGSIFTSYSSARVEGTGSVGGILGGSWGVIENSYATGEVVGEDNVGGLVGQIGIRVRGYSDSGEVIDSYSIGNVSGDDEETLGGLVGFIELGEVTGSFWNVETSGQDESDGGTGLPTAEMVRRETFTDAGWDLEENWNIIEDETYPFLQWQKEDTYPYAPELYELTINIEGQGTVEVYGEEVEDGWTQEYVEGTELTLEAIPDEGYEFDEWTGTDQTGDEINITMDEDKDITAHFEEITYNLTFVVTDEEGEAIEGATVTVSDEEVETNGSGEATFELTQGDYDYEVTHDDYEKENGMIDSLDEEKKETVELEESNGSPGFTVVLLALGAVIAVAIYKKKR